MNRSTAAALHRINSDFYRDHASSFSATRARAWQGWDRAVLPFLERWSATAGAGARASILDVGCGNGRFGAFLASRSNFWWDYFGIDASPPLIDLARKRLEPLSLLRTEFERMDLTGTTDLPRFGGAPFQVIVLFGILHHIAGQQYRRALLQALAAQLDRAGMLLLSFWQFGQHERFRDKMIPWELHNRRGGVQVDVDQLEPGDALLSWGRAVGSVRGVDELPPYRYCHFANESEADELVASLALKRVDRFLSDGESGDLNLYFVLQNR